VKRRASAIPGADGQALFLRAHHGNQDGMNIHTFRNLSVIASLVAASAIAVPAAASTVSNDQDKTFVIAAAQGGMAEVQDAGVALTNAGSPKVKAFAQKMVADHTKANAKLMTIAKTDGFTLPGGLSAADSKMKSQLGMEKGAAFDSAYLKGQVAGHEEMEAALKQEIASGKNPDLIAFAKATLPTVEEHLSMAKSDSPSSM
jgi:putative membrane protein